MKTLPSLLLLTIAATHLAGAEGTPPNVVFLIADDLGWRELGCYGQDKILTPNIDRLAAEGMRFTQHYSGNPVCATSRCVLMTGKHTGHAFVRNNHEVKSRVSQSAELGEIFGGQMPIPDEEVTLAELFKSRGYATGAFGKWGLGGEGTTGDPLKQGFDRFYGYNCQRHAHNFYPRYLVDDDRRVALEGNTHGLTGAQYAPDLYGAAALEFIRANKDRPFFVYFPTIVPHLALQVPEDSLAEYRGRWEDPPYEGGHGYLPHPAPRAAYAAMVTRMDRDVGRIMALVRELGLDERTIFVFTSDNGPTYDRLGGSDSEFFGSAGQLRGLKGSIYEGGMRVPLIVRWTGRVPAGTASDLPSAFCDWMPTLAELIGATSALPAGLDGVSIAPTLLGKQAEQKSRGFLYWEFPAYGGQQAVRMGDWKGVRTGLIPARQNPQPPNMAVQLYNLREDPSESRDVAREHPEVVAKIERILREQHVPSQEFPFPALDAK
jgi:arylsulfatase A